MTVKGGRRRPFKQIGKGRNRSDQGFRKEMRSRAHQGIGHHADGTKRNIDRTTDGMARQLLDGYRVGR